MNDQPVTFSTTVRLTGCVSLAPTRRAWRESGVTRFPVWQFRKSNGLLAGLAEILELVKTSSREMNDNQRLLLFLQGNGFLGGKRVLDLLRAGKLDLAKQAVLGELHV